MAAKLGSGARFAALKNKLASQGAHDPAALAAYIGRRKYGAKRFGQLSKGGHKHAALVRRMKKAR